jgi:hypothetical protein
MGGTILLTTIDKEGTLYGPGVQAFRCDSSLQCIAGRRGCGDYATMRPPFSVH